MDAVAGFRAALERFLGDIVFSFDTHGGRSAAVVWPRGESAVLRTLVAAHDRGEPCASKAARDVACKLGELASQPVVARFRTVPAADADEESTIEVDTFVVVLRGAVEVRLVPLGSAWPAEVSRLRHRLLAGEVLYIPARFGRVLSAQHAVPLVLELTLG